MTVFVVTEIEPEHAHARTIVGIFGTSQKAKAFVEKQQAALESGQHAGFATEYNRYVDGLATFAPSDIESYRDSAAGVAVNGYMKLVRDLQTEGAAK
jgi:hypothetical protein